MSWDVSIIKFAIAYRDVGDIPSDEVPLELGPRSHVHHCVLAVFPGTDWSDPSWGIWDSDAGSIEFNLGRDEPAKGMMLHVRSRGEVVPAIVRLCLENGWQGIDCSSGEFIEQSADATRGLESWAAYRDHALRTDREDA